MSKDTSAVTRDTDEAASSENFQPSSDVSLLVAHDAIVTQVDSPPWQNPAKRLRSLCTSMGMTRERRAT